MNLRSSVYILVIVLFATLSCKTAQYTPTVFEGEKLSFGNFGGFTGEMDAYHLLSNGQIFKQEGRKEVFTPLTSIKKKDAEAIFQQYNDLEINQMKLDQPGNLSYFIEIHSSEKDHKIIWSDESLQLNANIVAFYMQLYELTKTES